MQRSTWLPLLLILLSPLALGLPAVAQDYGYQPTATMHGQLELSLADALRMGLENNLDVEVERFDPLIAGFNKQSTWGSFDPELFGEVNYRNFEQPPVTALTPDAVQNFGGFGGVRGSLPYLSTEYRVQYNGNRQNNPLSINVLNPEYTTDIGVTLTQPLLRDLIWNQEWTRVKTSGVAEASTIDNFRGSVMNTIQAIEDAYWALIAAEEQLRVDQKSLETTRALLDQTQTQFEVGVVSKVEVTEAEAGVAEREVNLIRSENAFRSRQDELIDLVLGANMSARSTLEIDPTDQPEEYVIYEIDIEDAVQKAFSYRPELSIAKRELEREQIELKFAKNQRLPRIDAQVVIGRVGAAGQTNPNCQSFGTPEPCPTFDGTYRNSTDDFSDQITARGIVSFPFPNTTARKNVSIAQLELRRSQTRKRRLEQSIILEVRRTARDLASAQEGIGAAERRRLAAEEQLRAERIRLEYGESTPFDVLQRERDLVDAESEKIGALQLYRSSVTGLDRAQGTILRNRNIQIDQVASLR